MKDAAFDKAYVDNEVTYHEAVIDALDKTLIPSADNADLKALLIKVRPAAGALGSWCESGGGGYIDNACGDDAEHAVCAGNVGRAAWRQGEMGQ